MARDLTITHRASTRPAIEALDFVLEPGATLLLVGPSGAGKSTLALAIAGLIPREVPATMTGVLELSGADVRTFDRAAVAARVGLVFQDPSSQLVMERVEDDVAFGLENRGWPLSEMQARVPEVLAAAGLGGMERRLSRRLSGGQQQRLALAGVLAARPGLLVLDEPTANLDPSGAAAFFAWIDRLRAARETTIVLIEHRVEASWSLADAVLALDGDGRQLDVGTPAEVLERSGAPMHAAGIWLPDEPSSESSRPGIDGEITLGPTVVRAAGVTFGFDRAAPVIREVDLEVAAGERVALVGPNGSGKSTLGRLLVGLLRPDRGRIELGGDDPARLPAAELSRRAAYVFQEPERQFLAARVADEIMLGLEPSDRPQAETLMERLAMPLERFGPRSPYRLSGGEQRRLSLAVALVRDPAVLVLDEPTFGQDRHGYDALVAILDEHLAAGACLLAATHDPRFVRDVAGRVVELEDGRIAADSRPVVAALR